MDGAAEFTLLAAFPNSALSTYWLLIFGGMVVMLAVVIVIGRTLSQAMALPTALNRLPEVVSDVDLAAARPLAEVAEGLVAELEGSASRCNDAEIPSPVATEEAPPRKRIAA